MANNLYHNLLHNVSRHLATFGFVRFYGRWMHRNPAKVILPFEAKANNNLRKEKIIELDSQVFQKSPGNETVQENVKTCNDTLNTKSKFKDVKNKKETILKKRLFYLSQKKVFNDDNEILFEKLKENDARISTLFVKLKSKKERLRSNQVLVEGWRLIVDGLEAKCKLQYILFSRLEDLNNIRPFLPKTGIQIFKISYKEMELWSDIETSPGIYGIFEMPSPENVKRLSKPLPLHFLCDNIRIPGNLGAILRAAVGVGCEKVLVSKGSVDIWDPKVIRSAAGAHFRLPIYPAIEWDEIEQHIPDNTSLFIADSNTDFPENEKLANERVIGSEIPLLPYYSVDYSMLKHVTLVIGGETEGISEMSYRLGATKNGIRLNIPLQKGVDSLNTGMAAAVIAFEIRKQIVHAIAKKKLDREAFTS